jgi:hypothetical protein
MNWDREELQAAFEADDKARADYERWQRRKAQYLRKDAQELPLVYKRIDNALQQPEQPALMDATASAPWNSWLDNRVSEYMEIVDKDMLVLCDAIGTETGQMERRLDGKIEKLRAEVKALRAIVESGKNG